MKRRFTDRHPHKISLGDFNIDFYDFIFELDRIALTVVSKERTHFQATVPSLIDLFVTGEPGLVELSCNWHFLL
jgi:hypothetical protein